MKRPSRSVTSGVTAAPLALGADLVKLLHVLAITDEVLTHLELLARAAPERRR